MTPRKLPFRRSSHLAAAYLVATVAAVVACASRPATAQDADAPSPHEESGGPPNFFSLQRLDAAIELTGEYEQRRVRYERFGTFGGSRQTNRRLTFDEQLILDVEGATADRNLFSLAGTIGLGLTQERFRETFNGRTDADRNEGYLASYDLRADFLQGRKLSGSAYAYKAQDRYSRPFLPGLREERNDYGLSFFWTDDRLPMELTFDHRSVDRTGDRQDRDDENLTEDRLRYTATWITGPTHSARFTWEFSETEERYSGSRYTFHNTRNQFRVDDELLFGAQRQHRLDTVVRYQDESGDYARDLFEFGPRLSLRHSDSLTTQTQYQYSREEIGQLQIETHRADWQLIHQLYRNLTTTFNVFGLSERVDDDTETGELGAFVDWSYTRANRWGRFSANLSLTAESERTRGGGNRAVVAESGAFRDPLPVTLTRPNILPWTIVVRDARRLRIFVPGLDYFVSRVGDRTLLFRNLLGRIPNGATVSIDYLYAADADGSVDTQRADFRMQQDFDNGLTPYYALEFRHDDRDLSRGLFFGGDRDFESNRHRVGLRYRRDRLTAGGEFEALRDDIEPFLAYRLYSSYTLIRRPDRTLDARADFSHYFFDSRDRGDTVLLELSLDARATLNRAAEAWLTPTYRYEDDGTAGRGVIHGVDLEGGLSYRWGLLTLSATIEYDLLSIVDSKEDGMTVWFKVRRDLPNLAGVGR